MAAIRHCTETPRTADRILCAALPSPSLIRIMMEMLWLLVPSPVPHTHLDPSPTANTGPVCDLLLLSFLFPSFPTPFLPPLLVFLSLFPCFLPSLASSLLFLVKKLSIFSSTKNSAQGRSEMAEPTSSHIHTKSTLHTQQFLLRLEQTASVQGGIERPFLTDIQKYWTFVH